MKIIFVILSICLLSCVKVQAQLPSEKTFSVEKALAYKFDKKANPSQSTLTSLPSEARDWDNRVGKIRVKMKTVSRYKEPMLTSLPSTQKRDFQALINKYKKN